MEIYVPNYLHEGNNTIYLIVSDGNKNSTEVNKTFEFKFNPPILNITTADNQVLWKNTSKEFHFVGNLKDDDANGNVTIFYQFDGEQPKQANTYNITDNKIHDISYNATFPSNFSENNHHRISIWAIDETNKISENYILHFSYLFNDPILNLISPDKQAFKKNIDKFFIKLINGTNRRYKPGETVEIYLSYEHLDNTNLKSITTSYGNYHIIGIPVKKLTNSTYIISHSIPPKTKDGNYKVSILGTDYCDHQSNKIEINLFVKKYYATNEVDFEFVRNFKIRPKHYH